MSALELYASASPILAPGQSMPYRPPWYAESQHLFGRTPPFVDYVDDDGPVTDTCGVWAGDEDLLRNTLLIGQSGWGKTTIMFRALCWLLHATDTPMVIFDGSANGTLSKNLFLWWHGVLDRAERGFAAEGKTLRASLRRRLLYMKVEERNRCGVSFDLFHPSVVRTTDGYDEDMGVKEIVTALIGALSYMEEDNEKFKLVRTYGEAGLAVLLAAGKKAKDLPHLYHLGSVAFRQELRDEIERKFDLDLSVREVEDEDHLYPDWTTEYLEERDYIRMQWHIVNDLFEQVKNSATALKNEIGSTLRHFMWATTRFKAFFNRPIVRLDRFFNHGGVLVVHVDTGDRDADANARAATYASCRAAMRSKDRTRPCLFVLDEQQGWRMTLLADDVAANARNSAMYHWFSVHDMEEQLGRAAKRVWNACQRKIIGAVADEDVARLALLHTDLLRPDALNLPTVTTAAMHSRENATSARTSSGFIDSSGTSRGSESGKAAKQTFEAGHHEEIFEDRTTFKKKYDQWGAYDEPDQRFAAIVREHEPSKQQSRELYRSTSERATEESSVTRSQMTEQGSRAGVANTTTWGSTRIPIGELVTFFGRGFVNPPIGRGLHIEMGQEATFVDHQFDPLPLDEPGADQRLEQLVRTQRELLEDVWERRRPPRAIAAADEPTAMPPEPSGPAPSWANR